MAKLGTIALGKPGQSYAFNIYERNTDFKAIGAVYVMSKVNKDDRYKIIYVGQTGNLSDRPVNHHKTECFDEHGADKLLIHAEEHEKTRLEIETELVRYYNPPCND
jgi:hypothetical protein